jgi:hypothetical protein
LRSWEKPLERNRWRETQGGKQARPPAGIPAGSVYAADTSALARSAALTCPEGRADRQFAVTVEQPLDVHQRHRDHPALLVVLDSVALRGGVCLGRWTLVASNSEVEDVGTLVVDVVLELDASDG